MFQWFNELVSADMMAKSQDRLDMRIHAAKKSGKR